MERLESFVAGALVRRLGESNDMNAAASCSFRGAALFVDISGYTTLAETLCDQGPTGIERLGQTLDRAFRSHVKAVDDTKGEIACFAGDAVIAYWPADDGNVPRALARANDCAQRLHASAYDGATSSLRGPSLHIGLSAGDLWAARVGPEERRQILLAGPAVRQACAASVRAPAGGTIVAAQAGPFAASSSSTALDISGALDAADAALIAPALGLGAHVPRRVQEYSEEGFATWLPQRRTISALFIRLQGLDERETGALSRFQSVVGSLNLALRPYTGANGTLLLDDKGLVFTVCLGMPHDAHADDALRAVKAGLAVHSEMARVGIESAVGVATGPGVCMPLGGPQRRHYWAVGRFMHVAGRLMEAAGTGVLCTEEVADRVRLSVSLSPERPLMLKGLRWPLRPFRVSGASSAEESLEVLHGREDEQAAIDRYAGRCIEGQGTVLWIVAEAGIGKTALTHYLRQVAEAHKLRFLSGGAGSVEIAVAYVAWRPIFSALLGDSATAANASQDERRARLGSLKHPQLAPLINAVVPGFIDDSPLTQSLTGQARADATSSLLSEIILARASDRFVLVLEDCHWMDSASWRLALRVAQDYPQALIVLTSRPMAETQELQVLRRLKHFTEMPLAPLRPSAIEALVGGVLGDQTDDPELVEEIIERAVGNPLFAREYALLRSSQRSLDDQEARRRSRETTAAETVPVTVQSLIASRLDALTPAEDLALKTASVIGDTFNVDLIADACPRTGRGDTFPSLLADLEKRHLIVREGLEDFAFQHAMIREVSYGQLTTGQRVDLHQRVARAIEMKYTDDLRLHFAALAHHWSRAAEPVAGVKFADLAASQALAAGAFEEADRLLDSCVKQSDEAQLQIANAIRIRWNRQLADARHGMGQLEPRSAAAHEALRLAGRPRAHSTLGLIATAGVSFGGMQLRQMRDLPLPASEQPQHLDVARCYRHSAEVCYFNNDMLGMICDSVNAVACASALPPSAVLAGASTELGGILSVAGLRKTGERILQRAIAMAEAADDQAAQAYAHMVSCLYYVGIGDWVSAERSAERCQTLCEPMDDRVNWTNAQAVRFWMSHYRSREDAAHEAARGLRDRANETGNRQHRAWALRFLALCALRAGTPREAIPQLQAGLDCLGETAALNERIPTLGILALAQLKSGDVWAARATAREGLAQIVRVRRPIGHSTLEGYSSLIAVALDAWRQERSPQWRDAINLCLRVLGRYRKSFPVGEARYALHLGEYQRLCGSPGAARRSYRRGEVAATALGMPWELRLCKEGLAAL